MAADLIADTDLEKGFGGTKLIVRNSFGRS